MNISGAWPLTESTTSIECEKIRFDKTSLIVGLFIIDNVFRMNIASGG